MNTLSSSKLCGAPQPPAETEDGEFPSGATNPCKLCTPLGACLAFKGVEGCVPLLHGSQGCATYIRRYCISHYREPIDVASSNFSEDTAVFGGRKNLHLAIDNVSRQYRPKVIGIATTCLSETMGENVPMMLREYQNEARELPLEEERPVLVNVSTPSFRGTHAEGFHATVKAIVQGIVLGESDATPAAATPAPGSLARVALFSGMISPADIRHLKDVFDWWKLPLTLLPDYSETLDGPTWGDYERMPAGGTTVAELRAMRFAPAILEFGRVLGAASKTAGGLLHEKTAAPFHRLGLPIGLRETDRLMAALEVVTGSSIPDRLEKERGRLIDSYVDAHKYLAGKKAVIYGEDDMVVGLAAFVAETGIIPILCATGSKSGHMKAAIHAVVPEMADRIEVREGADFSDIEARIAELEPDMLIGSSKGHKLAKAREIPLIRCGFPVHDRLGAQRQQMLSYAGTQQLFDRIVNAMLEVKQDRSPIGYSYL